jgi:hypothetical protein
MSTQDAKKFVNNLKDAMKEQGIDIKLGQVYDLIAKSMNHKNYRTAKEVDPFFFDNFLQELSFVQGAHILESPDAQDMGLALRMPDEITDTLEDHEIKEIGSGSRCYVLSYERVCANRCDVIVNADSAQEAVRKAQEYYDNNGDSIRDDGSVWYEKEVLDKGGIRMIERYPVTGEKETPDEFEEEITYVPYIDDGDYLFSEHPALEEIDKVTIPDIKTEILKRYMHMPMSKLKEEMDKVEVTTLERMIATRVVKALGGDSKEMDKIERELSNE